MNWNRAGRAGFAVLSVVLLAASAVFSSPSTQTGPRPEPGTQREVLLNGLPIVTRTMPGDRVAVVVAVRAGAMFDPASKSGLASMTARMLAAGGGSYTAERIRAEIDDAGASLSIVTDWDATWLSAEAPVTSLATLLDVISLIVSAPRFEKAEFESVKKEYLERARASALDPDAVADLELARALYGRHTYGRSPEGEPASIEAISLGDVRSFWEKFYVANGGALAVAGGAQSDEVLRLAKPRFGRWRMGRLVPATFLAPQPPSATRVIVIDAPAVKEPSVRIGLLAPGRKSPDATGLFAVAGSIASRLGSTGAIVRYDPRALESPLVVSFKRSPADVAASVRSVVEALAALDRSASSDSASGRSGGDSAGEPWAAEAMRLASDTFYGNQKLSSGVQSGWTATTAQIAGAAKGLNTGAPTVVVVGPAASVEPSLKSSGFAVEVQRRP